MKLFESIDGLLVGTRYLAWGIGVLGVIGSIILFIVNVPLGIGTAAVFIASFFLAVAVALLLLPKQLAKGKLKSNKKYIVGVVSLVIAIVVMGIVYLSNGGFPAVNLIFV